VSVQVDTHIRMNHKNENEEGSGGQRHEQGYEYGTKIDLLFVFLVFNPHN